MAPQTIGQGVRQIDLRNDMAELDRMADFARDIGETQGLSADQRFALELCLEEAVTNIIMHGGLKDKKEPHIRVTLISGAPSLTICLEDDARPFDPTSVPPPEAAASLEEARIGGAGLPLMHKLTTEMSYQFRDGRNCLTLRFASPGHSESGVNA
jgi:anti-sigma regulatory factor (Ser/Thr protein kinase)